jgi:hypothetical protein
MEFQRLSFLGFILLHMSCHLQTKNQSNVQKINGKQFPTVIVDVAKSVDTHPNLKPIPSTRSLPNLFKSLSKWNPYFKKASTIQNDTRGLVWEPAALHKMYQDHVSELSDAAKEQITKWLNAQNPLDVLKAAHSIVTREVYSTLHNDTLLHIVTLCIDLKLAPPGFKSIYLTPSGMEYLITLAEHDFNQFMTLLNKPMSQVLDFLQKQSK